MKRRASALIVIFAAGCLAALSLGASRASAWTIDALPPGFATSHTHVNDAPSCADYYTISYASASGTFSRNLCTDSPTYQQDLDAFVDAHYTAPVTTTATTTQPGATTTVVITTTAPAATTATTTGPTDTTTAPVDTTVSAPAPAAPVTTVVTVITTATPLEQSLQAQIDALAAKIAALTDRVTVIEKAGDASWLAYQQSIANGDPADVAAGIARGTWLNAVYGLGDFAAAA